MFDPREMLQVSVMDEKTGIAFYKALAARAKRPDIESALITISKQEEIHAKRFQDMLSRMGEYKPQGEQYAGQHDEFINAMVESRAFPSPEAAAKEAESVKSDLEGIEMAIRLEKDALTLYGAIKPLLSLNDGSVVDSVMGEERAHLVELSRLRRTL